MKIDKSVISSLSALSPLDGRYQQSVSKLSDFFSEQALIKYRVIGEVKYFLFLCKEKIVPRITYDQEKQLLDFLKNFHISDAQKIKTIEVTTRHDVKAVEYYLQQKCKDFDIKHYEFIHFGLTSEDINSIALGLSLKDGLIQLILPALLQLIRELFAMAKKYKKVLMLARTHGQPAIPTTVGKELLVFAVRVGQEVKTLNNLQIEAKLTGAVGTLAAHVVSFPEKDWLSLSQKFITSLGLTPNIVTTQILPADSYVRIFQCLQLINTILINLSQDMWRYISDNYFIQKIHTQEVGSSTMPQKVNPIDFENCEGNLGMANSLLKYFIDKLPISRLQRDLSDSTVKRNIGVAFGYALLAYKNCLNGLQKITVNQKYLEEELLNHWEVVSEGIQTILRKVGKKDAYENLKQFTRGKKITEKEIKKFIEQLDISQNIREELEKITPLTYVGLAEKIVDEGIKIYAEK